MRRLSIETGAAVAGLLVSNRVVIRPPRIPRESVDVVQTAARWLARVGEFLRRSKNVGVGAVVAGLVTHVLAVGAINLSSVFPISTYFGFCQHVTIGIEQLWSHAHGWQSMMVEWPEVPEHAWSFGHAYWQMVNLLGPSIGFALFWILSRRHIGINVWKPVTIALMLMYVPRTFLPNPMTASDDVARAVIAVLLMAWSVGAFRISTVPACESAAGDYPLRQS